MESFNINSTTLSDGRIKHTVDDWTGYQNPNEPIAKTKWFKNNVKYWEIESASKSKPGVVYTYTVTKDSNNKISCSCLGYRYHRDCKHITEVRELHP